MRSSIPRRVTGCLASRRVGARRALANTRGLFSSRLLLRVGIVAASTAAPLSAQAALPRSTPERQGISSAAILAFVEQADSEIDAMHSFMLVRHGSVVAEGWWSPYDAVTPTCCIR